MGLTKRQKAMKAAWARSYKERTQARKIRLLQQKQISRSLDSVLGQRPRTVTGLRTKMCPKRLVLPSIKKDSSPMKTIGSDDYEDQANYSTAQIDNINSGMSLNTPRLRSFTNQRCKNSTVNACKDFHRSNEAAPLSISTNNSRCNFKKLKGLRSSCTISDSPDGRNVKDGNDREMEANKIQKKIKIENRQTKETENKPELPRVTHRPSLDQDLNPHKESSSSTPPIENLDFEFTCPNAFEWIRDGFELENNILLDKAKQCDDNLPCRINDQMDLTNNEHDNFKGSTSKHPSLIDPVGSKVEATRETRSKNSRFEKSVVRNDKNIKSSEDNDNSYSVNGEASVRNSLSRCISPRLRNLHSGTLTLDSIRQQVQSKDNRFVTELIQKTCIQDKTKKDTKDRQILENGASMMTKIYRSTNSPIILSKDSISGRSSLNKGTSADDQQSAEQQSTMDTNAQVNHEAEKSSRRKQRINLIDDNEDSIGLLSKPSLPSSTTSKYRTRNASSSQYVECSNATVNEKLDNSCAKTSKPRNAFASDAEKEMILFTKNANSEIINKDRECISSSSDTNLMPVNKKSQIFITEVCDKTMSTASNAISLGNAEDKEKNGKRLSKKVRFSKVVDLMDQRPLFLRQEQEFFIPEDEQRYQRFVGYHSCTGVSRCWLPLPPAWFEQKNGIYTGRVVTRMRLLRSLISWIKLPIACRLHCKFQMFERGVHYPWTPRSNEHGKDKCDAKQKSNNIDFCLAFIRVLQCLVNKQHPGLCSSLVCPICFKSPSHINESSSFRSIKNALTGSAHDDESQDFGSNAVKLSHHFMLEHRPVRRKKRRLNSTQLEMNFLESFDGSHCLKRYANEQLFQKIENEDQELESSSDYKLTIGDQWDLVPADELRAKARHSIDESDDVILEDRCKECGGKKKLNTAIDVSLSSGKQNIRKSRNVLVDDLSDDGNESDVSSLFEADSSEDMNQSDISTLFDQDNQTLSDYYEIFEFPNEKKDTETNDDCTISHCSMDDNEYIQNSRKESGRDNEITVESMPATSSSDGKNEKNDDLLLIKNSFFGGHKNVKNTSLTKKLNRLQQRMREITPRNEKLNDNENDDWRSKPSPFPDLELRVHGNRHIKILKNEKLFMKPVVLCKRLSQFDLVQITSSYQRIIDDSTQDDSDSSEAEHLKNFDNNPVRHHGSNSKTKSCNQVQNRVKTNIIVHNECLPLDNQCRENNRNKIPIRDQENHDSDIEIIKPPFTIKTEPSEFLSGIQTSPIDYSNVGCRINHPSSTVQDNELETRFFTRREMRTEFHGIDRDGDLDQNQGVNHSQHRNQVFQAQVDSYNDQFLYRGYFQLQDHQVDSKVALKTVLDAHSSAISQSSSTQSNHRISPMQYGEELPIQVRLKSERRDHASR